MRESKYKHYPKHFLAETPDEAEKIFLKYSKLLNGISYTYSISTGIDKGDLFGEAIMALADAIKNFNNSKECSFDTYVNVVIKRRLDKYSLLNSYSVYVPSYIKQAHRHVTKLKFIVDNLELSINEADKFLFEEDINTDIVVSKNTLVKIRELKKLISKNAKRSSISYAKLVERAICIPTEVDLTDNTIEAKYENSEKERLVEVKLFVDKLKTYMSDLELSICQDIMAGMTHKQIAKKHNKTTPWVNYRLKKLKNKLINELKGG